MREDVGDAPPGMGEVVGAVAGADVVRGDKTRAGVARAELAAEVDYRAGGRRD